MPGPKSVEAPGAGGRTPSAAPSPAAPLPSSKDADAQPRDAAEDDRVTVMPLLLKPRARSRRQALHSALHLGVCSAAAMLSFGVVAVATTFVLDPRDPLVIHFRRACSVRHAWPCAAAAAAAAIIEPPRPGSPTRRWR